MSARNDDPGSTRGRRQRVQAAATGMAVLNGLAWLGGRSTLTALARKVNENPAKVHRYLISMMEEGLVEQDPASLQYYLGAGAIRVGLAAMRQADPLRVAQPALLRLRQTLEMTCFIAVMGNKGPTVVRIEEPALPAVLNVRVGSVLPLLWSATGRVFLAYLEGSGIDELAREELVHMPPASQAPDGQPDLLQRVRRDVRTAGVATVRDITLAGISAVSVPVFQYTGGLAAVLTVLGATGSFDTGPRGQVAQAALEESAAISAALGSPN